MDYSHTDQLYFSLHPAADLKPKPVRRRLKKKPRSVKRLIEPKTELLFDERI